jgi:hypothetical protein
MADHYRTLIQSLMQLGFFFRRLGERKQEVWRNRLTDQEVMFDRREVSGSRTTADEVLKQAKAAKPARKPADKAAVAPAGRSAAKAVKAVKGAAEAAAKPEGKATSAGKRKPGGGRRAR